MEKKRATRYFLSILIYFEPLVPAGQWLNSKVVPKSNAKVKETPLNPIELEFLSFDLHKLPMGVGILAANTKFVEKL